ncbi:MAG TPA: TraR/DksA family transcriptional regulator [Candidatus Nanoarchaeia archaeon]|nr:RNA polymerase-binding transcription factor DksA [uncultured archaeon]
MDLKHFKEKLLAEKANLEKGIKSYQAKDPYFDNRMAESFDDDISEIEGHDRTIVTEAELQETLNRVEEALKRIASGTYGKCENCGQEIDRARLEVMPTARFCASCQQQKKGT